jgi:hypothetical protein
MIEPMGLKSLHRGTLEWHFLHTKFHENLPSDSKVIIGDTQTDRQTGDMISPLLFFESRLKIVILHMTLLYMIWILYQ